MLKRELSYTRRVARGNLDLCTVEMGYFPVRRNKNQADIYHLLNK